MKRIMVIGCCGAGKSTFAKKLQSITRIELIHLDQCYWKPGWVETSPAQWEETMYELCAKDQWIIDGNYGGTMDIRLQHADTIIFLDYSTITCLWRITKRTLQYRKRNRPDMNEGCPERFDLNLYRFVASYNKRKRPEIYKKLDALRSSKTVVVLKKNEDIDRFLHGIKNKVVAGITPLLHTYNLQWPQDFAAIKGIIEGSMSLIPTDIQHIGSTAVPGLLAKPIIDIDLIYPAHSDFEAIKTALQGLGYRHHGDQGIKGREVFKRIKIQDPHPILDHISHHLYVCHVDNPELERHLIFRDHLIKNEADRNAYGELKQKIAGETEQDRKRYAKRKETMAREFIEKVLAKAQNR